MNMDIIKIVIIFAKNVQVNSVNVQIKVRVYNAKE